MAFSTEARLLGRKSAANTGNRSSAKQLLVVSPPCRNLSLIGERQPPQTMSSVAQGSLAATPRPADDAVAHGARGGAMRIGFIGTGTMGTPIAACLVAAGH